MALPTLPIPLDDLFLVGWLLLLTLAYYRFRRGEFSRRRLYAFAAPTSVAIGTSLVERADSVADPLDTILEGTGLFVVVLGVLAGVRWWRLRRAEDGERDA